MRNYAILATAAWVATYVLIVVGGIVRVTGSGLGCPDWPLCENQAIPPPRVDAWIEFSHRFSAVITSVLIVASTVFAFFPKRRPSAPWLAASVVALAFQIGLGGIVVILELPALAVNLHLMVALVVLALVIVGSVTVWPERLRQARDSATVRALSLPAVLATLGVFVLIVSGSYVFGSGASLACNGWPLCEGNSIPTRGLDAINFLHRIVAAAIGVLLFWVCFRAWRLRSVSPSVGNAGLITGLLFIAQSLVGAGVVLARLNGPWPALHLALAAAVWASLIILTTLTMITSSPTPDLASRAAAPPAERRPVSQTVQSYIGLTKPVIVLLLLITTLAAMFVAAGGAPPLELLIATFIGGALSAGGANAINCYIDRDIDPLMNRTRRRPHVSGRVPPRNALLFGITLGALSFVLLTYTVNLLTAVLALSGLVFYVLVYTSYLKRSTTHNIVIGGAAGAIPPLVGWAAVTGRLELPAFYLFAIVFYWTPPHFWALALLTKADYAKARIPMLPVIRGDEETRRQILLYSVLLVAVSLLLFGGQAMGTFYLVTAVLLGAGWMWYAYRLYRDRTEQLAKKLFVFSNNYLALLFAAMVFDRVIRL